jgi:hypothetical protein
MPAHGIENICVDRKRLPAYHPPLPTQASRDLGLQTRGTGPGNRGLTCSTVSSLRFPHVELKLLFQQAYNLNLYYILIRQRQKGSEGLVYGQAERSARWEGSCSSRHMATGLRTAQVLNRGPTTWDVCCFLYAETV